MLDSGGCPSCPPPVCSCASRLPPASERWASSASSPMSKARPWEPCVTRFAVASLVLWAAPLRLRRPVPHTRAVAIRPRPGARPRRRWLQRTGRRLLRGTAAHRPGAARVAALHLPGHRHRRGDPARTRASESAACSSARMSSWQAIHERTPLPSPLEQRRARSQSARPLVRTRRRRVSGRSPRCASAFGERSNHLPALT
jgi:hypothetical protein